MIKLGFGCMRLPLKSSDDYARIDMESFKQMVDAFLEQGGRYFDTAYMYHNGMSEVAVREGLVLRHPRDSFMLADKMPLVMLKSRADHDRIFNEQLERCGVDFFDAYLAHNIGRETYKTARELGTFDFIREKKKEGKVRKIGFSFHDSADFLDTVLAEHPDVDFVQLQINYLDWQSESIQSGKCHAVARKHGKQIIVMEPVKGGMLADIPAEAARLLEARRPEWSIPSWAVRYAASPDGVALVLSGMSDLRQLLDNTGYMRDFKPLTQDEQAAIAKVVSIIEGAVAISCTACQYCASDCPQNIPIPKYFALFNDKKRAGVLPFYLQQVYYNNYIKAHGKASECIRCGRCEKHCPQKLAVMSLLETVAADFEPAELK